MCANHGHYVCTYITHGYGMCATATHMNDVCVYIYRTRGQGTRATHRHDVCIYIEHMGTVLCAAILSKPRAKCSDRKHLLVLTHS